MKKIYLNLKNSKYDVIIGRGVLNDLPGIIKKMKFSGPVVFITDKTVMLKHSRKINRVLKTITNEKHEIKVRGEERSKSIEVFSSIVNSLSKKVKMSVPLIVAIGGGVTGDLAGFIAATYRRGVPLIQIPTTLLSQVDSSIGGKTGIDMEYAKNIIGAFKQPCSVISDTEFLKTLTDNQISEGMAEVVKYGIIKDPTILSLVEKNVKNIFAREESILLEIVYRCGSIKALVVKKDEFDIKDHRIILNFGHTIGHAIESAAGYKGAYTHGQAVSIGMLIAACIAVKLNMLNKLSLVRMKDLLMSLKLPVEIKNVPLKKILHSYKHDKKFISGTNRFVLPSDIGNVSVVENVPENIIVEALKEYST